MINVDPIQEVEFNHLASDELLTLIADDLYDGQVDLMYEDVSEALQRGLTSADILKSGLVVGMNLVSDDFRDGILFVPHVLQAAKALQVATAVLQPHLPDLTQMDMAGVTKGDVQSIGQTLVEMLIRPNGFDTYQIVSIVLKWPGVDLVELGTYVWASGL